jgi:hypothetical protein
MIFDELVKCGTIIDFIYIERVVLVHFEDEGSAHKAIKKCQDGWYIGEYSYLDLSPD